MKGVLFLANQHIALDQITLTILKGTKADAAAAESEGLLRVTTEFIYGKLL
jgi:hypothetical protein